MSQPTRYDDHRTFLAAHGAWLRRSEARNNLILGLAQSSGPAVFYASQGAVCSVSRRGVAIAARSRIEGIRALARSLSDAEFHSTFGPLQETLAFVESRCALTHNSARRSRDSWGYQLTSIRSVPAASGFARLAQPRDHKQIVDWLAQFGEETGFGVGATDAPLLARSPEWWIWEDSGVPAAMLRLAPVSDRSSRIAYVYTPPAQRGHGYAGALTAHVSALSLARGHRALYLFTDASNPISNRLYRRLGYRKIGDFVQFEFDQP